MDSIHNKKLCQIGEIAQKAGVTVRTVRYYMEEGFIEPADRSGGGFYLFSPETADSAFFINKLRDAGFALKQIKALYLARKNGTTGHEASTRVLALLMEQKLAIEKKIKEYQELEAEIKDALELVSQCQGCRHAPTRKICSNCSVLTSRNKLPLPCQAII